MELGKKIDICGDKTLIFMAKAIKLTGVGRTAGGGTSGVVNRNTPSDSDADVRDSVAGLVGGGYKSVSDDVARGHMGRLITELGEDKARKLMTHIFIQNQRPEMQNIPVEAKLTKFYSTGASDPDIAGVIARTKALGSGPVSGFWDSSNKVNRVMGGEAASTPSAKPSDTDAMQKTVMLKLAKK